MTDQNKTAIGIVLDRSGSMSSIKGDAEGALKQFIEDQKRLPGTVRLWLVRFDSQVEVRHRNKDLREVDGIKLEPRNMTALYDAIGTAITTMGEDLAAMSEDERPGKVLLAIVTDGYENHSKEYTHAQISEMIKRQQDEWQWEVLFLAANQDAMVVGTQLNVPAQNTLNWQTTREGTQYAGASLSAYTTKYRETGHGSFEGTSSTS